MKNITNFLKTNYKIIIPVILFIGLNGFSYYMGTQNLISEKANAIKYGELTIEYEETIKKYDTIIDNLEIAQNKQVEELNTNHKNEVTTITEDAKKQLEAKQKECDEKNAKLSEITKILGIPDLQKQLEEKNKEIETLK